MGEGDEFVDVVTAAGWTPTLASLRCGFAGGPGVVADDEIAGVAFFEDLPVAAEVDVVYRVEGAGVVHFLHDAATRAVVDAAHDDTAQFQAAHGDPPGAIIRAHFVGLGDLHESVPGVVGVGVHAIIDQVARLVVLRGLRGVA